MAVFTLVKFHVFMEHMAKKVHDLDGDALKVYLTNTAPNAATHAVKADIAEISAGNGYTAGGADFAGTISRTGATTTLAGSTVSWTATGGSIGPFRYAILYNDTPTSPADALIGYGDYGSSITPGAGETFAVSFGSSIIDFT